RWSRGVGPGEQEAAVGVVGAGGPDLLAVEDPPVPVLHRPGRKAGEVAAGIGLAEALGPDLVAGEELLDVRVLLPLAAEDVDGRRGEADAEPAEDGRRATGRKLLLEDRLLDRRGAHPALLLRPGKLQPVALVENPLPVT